MKRLGMMGILSLFAVSQLAFAQSTIRVEKMKVEKKVKKEEVSKKETSQDEVKITRQIDLGEILSGIYPEVNFMRKAATANDINIRGFMRDNINVLIDDSRIYGACPNRMDPAPFHVSTPQIEKIEIKEGPFDVENAGSLAAVVNVKTKDPVEGVGGEAGLIAGSFSYRTAYIWGNAGNRYVKVLAGASNQYAKPYETGEGKKITEYAFNYSCRGQNNGRYRDTAINEKAFNIDRVWTKAIISPTESLEIKLSYAFENARNVLYPALKMDAPVDRTHRYNADLYLKDIGVRVSGYYNTVKHDMNDALRTSSNFTAYPGTGYSMRTYAESSVAGGKIVKEGVDVASAKVDFGVEYYLRNWKADNWATGRNQQGQPVPVRNPGMIPDVDIRNIGGFVKGVKDIGNWTVSAGLRVDTTKSEADRNAITGNNRVFITNGLLNSFSKTDTYPSGYILGKYNIDRKNNVYIGFGHTVRVPDPMERYLALMGSSPWFGNPNLKPTKNNELDIGGEFFPANNLSLRVNLFYSDLTDYIYLRRYQANNQCAAGSTGTTQCTTYQNIDAKIYGGDFGLLYAFNEKLSAEFSVAYQRGKKDSGVYRDPDLAEVPPLKSRVALKYDDSKFYGLVEGIYQKRQSNVDSDLFEIPTPPYFIMNIKAGYTYNNRLFAGVGVDNLFDRLYYNYLSYVRDPFRGVAQNINGQWVAIRLPEPGRFIYANISYRF